VAHDLGSPTSNWRSLYVGDVVAANSLTVNGAYPLLIGGSGGGGGGDATIDANIVITGNLQVVGDLVAPNYVVDPAQLDGVLTDLAIDFVGNLIVSPEQIIGNLSNIEMIFVGGLNAEALTEGRLDSARLPLEPQITGNLTPSANVLYDLGSLTHRWKDLYLAGNTLYLGNTFIREGLNESIQLGGQTTVVSAEAFAGNGAALISLNASELTTGIIPAARFGVNVAVGTGAGQVTQGPDATALGREAGQVSQGQNTTALGYGAGQISQGNAATAAGYFAGQVSQGQNASALGYGAGQISQSSNSTAAGYFAGQTSQGTNATALGHGAGQTVQGNAATAVGFLAGQTSQGQNASALGFGAGQTRQGSNAVSLGYLSGNEAQGNLAVSLGYLAGQTSQGDQGVAVGYAAGSNAQGAGAVALGRGAGSTSQGSNAIAIGSSAGHTSQAANSIVINATGTVLNNTTANSLVIKPVRDIGGNTAARSVLVYDDATGEIGADKSTALTIGRTPEQVVSTWTTQTSAADNQWISVTWAAELGIFVAVANSGDGNRVMTSPDGINWTSRTSAANNFWISVCWAPELRLFVAVGGGPGTGNRVMTSPDGANWTAQTSAADITWQAVTWSPELGILVAVASTGTGNRVMTSPDGINWTARTSAVDNQWTSVVWAPELSLFVAVANTGTGNRVMTSPDGINWTIRTSAADNQWRSVTWSPKLGIFVAVAQSGTGNRVMTSPDGINWTARDTTGKDNEWFGVCWSPELGLFVAVARAGTGDRVMTSFNGITWTSRNVATSNAWRSVTWAPELGIFVAVADYGTGNDHVMTSARWSPLISRGPLAVGLTAADDPPATQGLDVARGGAVIRGDFDVFSKGATRTVGKSGGGFYGGSKGYGSSKPLFEIESLDAPDVVRTWVTRASAADNQWLSVAWAPELGLFVAVANSSTGNRVMTSPDGINWTARTSAADNEWHSVTWAPELSLFVAVATTGIGNRVMTSPDGITWTARTSAADNFWYSVVWAPELGIFVAVALSGTGNRVMTSPDGVTWTARNTTGKDNDWLSIAWAPELGIFAAVAYSGTGNRVMTSPDGINWTARTSAADNQWRSVAWAPELGLFVAVAASGTGNRVMTSPDGITWTSRTSAADNQWLSVAWAPELGIFVAVADSGTGNRVMTSPDGINWTARTSAADNNWFGIRWAPELGIFCAVSYTGTGNRVMTTASPASSTTIRGGRLGIGKNAANVNASLDVVGEIRGSYLRSDGSRVAVGADAGLTGQGTSSVAIGLSAGANVQATASVAIGVNAGSNTQGSNAVAIGSSAGQSSQGVEAVAVGFAAGLTSQSFEAVAIGRSAGGTGQKDSAVAVGAYAGTTGQGALAVAVGRNAGSNTQGVLAVAVGHLAGQTSQGSSSVAIGYLAGANVQATASVAIGVDAGSNTQGSSSVAVGTGAGLSIQGNLAVAIGRSSGRTSQGDQTVAIGYDASLTSQKYRAISIGSGAGQTTQGSNAVAIGALAGYSNQANTSIVINATGEVLNNTTANSCVIKPVRDYASIARRVALYDATSGEVSTSSGRFVVQSNNTVDIINNNGTGTTTLALKTTGGANSLIPCLSFYPTFGGSITDTGPRRAADISAGFNGGIWGTQYLAFHTGSAANDVQNITVERMRIDANGNVGIGLTSPQAQLHIPFIGSLANQTLKLGSGTTYGESIYALFFADGGQMGMGPYPAARGVFSRQGLGIHVASTEEFSIKSSSWTNLFGVEGGTGKTYILGNLGIGTTAPGGRLTVKQTNTADLSINGHGLRMENGSNANRWDLGIVNNSDNNFAFAYNGAYKGYFSSTGGNVLQNFTGQHRCTVRDVPQSDMDAFVGLIVVADRSEYVRMSGGIARGKDAITINEALPIVSLATTDRDPRAFGVVSAAEDPDGRQDAYGSFVTPFPKERGDTRAYINSVGEGAIWVADFGTSLQSGEYITTTAAIPGYGARQDDDDVLRAHTVAKITMDCDFDPPIIPKYRIKKRTVSKRIESTRVETREVSETVFDDVAQRYVRKTVTKEETVTNTEEVPVYDEITGEIIPGETVTVPIMIEQAVDENDLDEDGNLQWEPIPGEFEPAYAMRYLRADGTVITKAEYESSSSSDLPVYRAAFVGCTYHCG
jgi:hypothetical protein